MNTRVAKTCFVLSLFGCAALLRAEVIFQDDFEGDTHQWIVEQMAGGNVEIGHGRMSIFDKKGCTVWYREKLRAPVSISYDASFRDDARLSDLNCFWMASDPKHPENLFFAEHSRDGAFAKYDSLQTYYVGYGGNNNTTTRFRRYTGTGARPLLPEHDLHDKDVLLKAGHTYHLQLIAREGAAEFVCDGKTLFRFKDPEPLTEGWFGIRTVESHLEIRNLRIEQLARPPSSH